jgi:dsRNA-specific ribonuclease
VVLAIALDVPGVLRFYQREVSQARSRKTLAEIFLSLIGAIFLDQGLEASSTFIKRMLPILG